MCMTNALDKKKEKKKKKKKETSTVSVREVHHIKKEKNLHWMYKRNSQSRNQDSTGCVRETPRINIKAARDV